MRTVSKITYRTEVTIYFDMGESHSADDYLKLNGWERTRACVGGSNYHGNHNYFSRATYMKTFADRDIMEKEVKEIDILFNSDRKDERGGVMGRLIDAEKCPCKTCGISYCHENCKKYYEWLNGCDYDVEKVVAELEKVKRNPSGCYGVHCGDCKYTDKCFEGEQSHKVALDNAIEIVRKGGVE